MHLFFIKGKTSLLNVLTFKNNGKLKITGEVKINGKYIKDSSEINSISGYVQQEDLFIGTLKVKEHLRFQVYLYFCFEIESNVKQNSN